MCGIAGLLASHSSQDLSVEARTMIRVLAHRGPDDEGFWIDAEQGVALAHRRLAIVDLSPQGHQPMHSADGRYVLVFNGEIYNHLELRRDLEALGHGGVWRGHSDTEVLLAGIAAWGAEALLQRSVGMFAIALWDRRDRRLLLARDRMGEKPIYYTREGGRWLFASELKAIRTVSQSGLSIDRDALAEFMQSGYVPSPRSIYAGVRKLPPGHFVWLSAEGPEASPAPFWSLDTSRQRQAAQAFALMPEADLLDVVHAQLKSAVELQMMADVPLGAFLSGGIDSSLIVSLMQAQSGRAVRTFTIGFDDQAFNEAPFAAAVARHLGTEHTELHVTASDAERVIPDLPTIYDEPFADSSQIPTVLVSRLTRQHVTVSLSGDGGDELFAGYPRYLLAAKMWKRMQKVPVLVRKLTAHALVGVQPKAWDSLLSFAPGAVKNSLSGRRIHRFGNAFNATELSELYTRLLAQWQPEDAVVLGADPPQIDRAQWSAAGSAIYRMQRNDLVRYLPDDLMVKVDRAAMSASLESRAPFLDHRVVELAMALPQGMLMRGNQGKWALRRVLDRYMPTELVDRPKAGFAVPLAAWLRGSLKGWAQELLDPHSLRSQGFFDSAKIEEAWRQHLNGSADRSTLLWNVLMYQSWYARQADA